MSFLKALIKVSKVYQNYAHPACGKNLKTWHNEDMKKAGKKVVMVSGGFDPLHIGHVRYMQSARALGDELVVVVNNNNWFALKGKNVFMHDKERKEIIEALACVDRVVISGHTKGTKDISVCKEIKKVKPDIFANGGDRFADNIPEFQLCKKMGIEMVFNVGHGGKVRSSSELLKKYSKKIKK